MKDNASKAPSATRLSNDDKPDCLELNRMGYQGFHTVEFASRRMPNFRNYLTDVGEVSSLAEKCGRYETYTSMYLYPEKVIDYVRENHRNGRPSISGYDGPIYSNFLFLDIDSKDELKAKRSAERVVSFLYDGWGLREDAVTTSYSGAKGYHLQIDSRVFGDVAPSDKLHRVYAELRKDIQGLARIQDDTIDHSIKDRTRLIRLANTQNAKSGRYKIQIAPEDFFGLPVYAIKEMAREPQPVIFTDETGLVPANHVKRNEHAAEAFQKAMTRLNGSASYEVTDNNHIDDAKGLKEVLCEARLNLFKNHVPEGQRNNSALVLASAFRSGGYSEARARDLILYWNHANQIGLSERELASVVHSVYLAKNGYSFGCGSFNGYCPYKNWKDCHDYREFLTKNRVTDSGKEN
ncbi:MAG: primase C-terminal domain-containing protein [Nitrososphaera sp.]|nr:primase C-terminal domain-containing protein [Nitrososphaera sp.]